MAREDIRRWASRHPVASFFTLAYAISWLGWLPAVLGYRGDLDQILSMIAQFGPAVAASLVLGGVWATWHLPLVFVDPGAPHGFTALAPLVLMFLLTLLTIVFYAFFYTWVYNATHSVLMCMILHGAFNTATGLVPAPFETLQRWVYVTLLVVQNVTLLVAVAVLVVATGGMLAYNTRPGGNSEAKTLAYERERS